MDPTYPRITIVTPSFNQAKYIDRTIQSVLSQDYPNLEYIILDGASTDETVSILKKYDGQIIWKSEKDKGQSDAINKGLEMASGEIVSYLNSDDILSPGSLHAVAKFFVDHPKSRWVTGKCNIIDESGNEIRKSITSYKNFFLASKSYTILKILDYISQPATFWRKSVLAEIGYFDENLHYTMDYEYWLRFEKIDKINLVNQYLASFRVHSTSKTVTAAYSQLNEAQKTIKRITRNPLLISLQWLHGWLTIQIYHWFYDKGGKLYKAQQNESK